MIEGQGVPAGAVLSTAIVEFDCWLEGMRGPGGYSGPIVHWWRNCMQYTGPGLDWRYEGIITGYLNLFEATGDRLWLAKAKQSGNDLARGQLPDGSFQDSSFELNPRPGGTPHEACCDIALLRLATSLELCHDADAVRFRKVAETNIEDCYLNRLWDYEENCLRDSQGAPSFVPNKAASFVEAILLLSRLGAETDLVRQYAVPTLDEILRHQVSSGAFDGAIFQFSIRRNPIWSFFPFYIGRCIPALVSGSSVTGDRRYRLAAAKAAHFILKCAYANGSYPQVIYGNGRENRYPQWIAAVGDTILALESVCGEEVQKELLSSCGWLLAGRRQTGAFRTAHGFGWDASQRAAERIPEFRDLLPVCGWSAMAFRYLTALAVRERKLGDLPDLRPQTSGDWVLNEECLIGNRRATLHEDPRTIQLVQNGESVYRWKKGEPWASAADSSLLWK